MVRALLPLLAIVLVGCEQIPPEFIWEYFASGVVGMLLATVVHELGHAAAALAVGWHVHSIEIFGTQYLVAEGRFAGRGPGPKVLGRVSTVPRSWRWPAREHIVMLAGGSAANLLVAATFFGFGLAAHAPVVLVLGVMQLYMGVLNLAPFTRLGGQLRTDGLVILDSLRDRRDMPLLRAHWVWIRQQLPDGLDAAALDAEVVALLEADSAAAAFHPARELILASRYGGEGRHPAQRAALERLVAGSPSVLPALGSMLALLRALDRDVAGAEALLRNAAPPDTFDWCRVRAVLAALRGDRDAALAELAAWRRLRPDLGDADDQALVRAIEGGEELPTLPSFSRRSTPG